MIEARELKCSLFDRAEIFAILNNEYEQSYTSIRKAQKRFAYFLTSLQLNHNFSYECLSKLLNIPADNLKSPYSLTVKELNKIDSLMNLIKP